MNRVASAYRRFKRSQTIPPFPERVIVELTNRCNYSCVMCPRRFMKDRLGIMAMPLFKKIIDEAGRYPGTIITPFFRGESLLHPQIIPCLKYIASKKNLSILLATNGALMTASLADRLLDTKIDFISFSVDAVDPETYRRIRNGSYEKVKQNIIHFIKKKKKRRLSRPVIQVSAVDTADSHAGLDSFVSFWLKHADRVRIYPEHTQDGRFGSLGYRDTRRKPCFKPLSEIAIYWNGEMGLCNHDWNHPLNIGNVRNISVAEAWHGTAYHQVRTAHLNNTFTNTMPCHGCDHWKMYYQHRKIVGSLFLRRTKNKKQKGKFHHD
ncbi:MAG: radical SAM protein [Elusimicrobia bacterium]|nr:radical SAM protein [Elusimicrobiota bacterium]MBD3412624.1 radical SAM protein [Elusimicrobiota bacterium]